MNLTNLNRNLMRLTDPKTFDEKGNLMKKKLHAVPMAAKQFAESDLELSKKYINPKDCYPNLYDNSVLKETFPGLRYKGRKIINIEDISFDLDDVKEAKSDIFVNRDVDLSFIYQKNGRVHVNPERDRIHKNMDKKGYELCNIPPSVCYLPDGICHIMDGRTRLEYLILRGFKNVIVDVYESDNPEPFEEWQVYANPPQEIRGPQKMEDIIRLGRKKIISGELPRSEVVVSEWVNKISRKAHNESLIGNIVDAILAGNIISESNYYSEENAQNWLKVNGYNDNVNNNGIYYLIVSHESKASSVLVAAKHLQTLISSGKTIKQLRIVMNPGKFRGGNPDKAWKKRIDVFRAQFTSNVNILRDSYFKNAEFSNVIQLYGAIPTIHSLAQDFPLNRLVIFSGPPLNYRYFEEYDRNNELTEIFDTEDYSEEYEEA